MRFIRKGIYGGYHLQKAHCSPPIDSATASSRWGAFSDKQAVLGFLLDEQYQICCYSELRADEEGLGYHIEHVVNKAQAPERTFDFTNLAASALHADDLTLLRGEAFGGHAPGKQGECDPDRFVSCHRSDCARFFRYLSDGRVAASNTLIEADRDRAEYTIGVLNLNSPYLVNLRRQWWDELDQLWSEHEHKGWEPRDLVAIDLLPDNRGLRRFFSLSRQFYGALAEVVLQNEAPFPV